MTESATPTAAGSAATSNPDRPLIAFDIVALDTADPPGLAEFYNTLLGWQTERVDDDWITISGGGGARLAFQLAPDHKAPTWPDNEVPQQIHFDFKVDDLAEAAAYAESVGARRLTEAQDGFIVFLDPSGHPFCLCD